MAQDRVTAVDIEALNAGAANARVTAVDLEALNIGDANARITAVDIEVLVPLHPIIYQAFFRDRTPPRREPFQSQLYNRRRLFQLGMAAPVAGDDFMISLIWAAWPQL